jgi:hypothetical protein
MHLLFSITSIEMYFMSGICAFVAFVANLIKKYEKWKVLASGFDGVRVARLCKDDLMGGECRLL